jgi:outer membrane protein assembly factor BamB
VRLPALILITILGASGCASLSMEGRKPARFSFIHVSDTHIGPYDSTPQTLQNERGYATFQAMKDSLRAPLVLEPFGVTAPPPALIVNTGDVTEYGFPGATLDVTNRYHEGIRIPTYWVGGNHDNTWVSHPELFRQRFGGNDYHFEHKGIHFIGLMSATLQEPAQSFGEETRRFVEATAERIKPGSPVIMMFHHPFSNPLWSSEYDYGRVFNSLRRHNVVAVLVGHHHAVRAETWSGYDVVHGGSTFSKTDSENPVDGYNMALVEGDRIQIAYRFRTNDRATVPLLDKSLVADTGRPWLDARTAGRSILSSGFELLVSADAWMPSGTPARQSLQFTMVMADGTRIPMPRQTDTLTATGSARVDDLPNGRHWLKVQLEREGKLLDEQFLEFTLNRPNRITEGIQLWSTGLGGGVKHSPLLHEGSLLVGTNAGTVVRLDARSGRIQWTATTGAEVLGTPAVADGKVIVGTTAGEILFLNEATGRVTKRIRAPKPIYTAPLVHDGRVIVSGFDGLVTAWNLADGSLAWENRAAAMAVELPPVVAGGKLLYNAWDGYLHAADLVSGEPLWKAASPHSQARVVRYYGGADYQPIVADDAIYTTDRGYTAGVYTMTGKFQRILGTGITALALGEDGRSLLARRLDAPFARLGMDGSVIWESEFKAGRLPNPAVESGGVVYTTVGASRLAALDGATGATLWTWEVTPGLYVLAAPVVAGGVVYTVGLDGVLQAVRGPGQVVSAGRSPQRAVQ